jgi:predicted nucleotidyltransferase
LPEAAITDIFRRHQVKELCLFGSAARGDMMTRELAALLGRRIDLAVKRALKPLIRPAVLADAQLIYAA